MPRSLELFRKAPLLADLEAVKGMLVNHAEMDHDQVLSCASLN
jgi:hypothetical protein